MQDPSNISPGQPPGGGYPLDDGPRPSSGRNILFGLGLLAIFAGGYWFFSGSRLGQLPPPPPVVEAPAADAGAAEPLPSLAERDFATRDALAGLSPLPQWTEWLTQSDLLGRFTAAVANIADGESPRGALGFLSPGGTFEVVERKRKLYAAPSSFARYDAVVKVVDSVDVNGAAAAYRKLEPLIDGVYAQIARPGARFEDTLKAALDRMAAVPIPGAAPELVSRGAVFAYADPALEGLTAAEKHLLRLGTANARLVQRKCQELRAALFPAAETSPVAAPDGGG